MAAPGLVFEAMAGTQDAHPFIPYAPERISEREALERASSFRELMGERRSVRHFSDEAVPRALIEEAILTASSAPSGAHQQPWTFVAISSQEIKHKIRLAAEEEEKISYGGRMSEEWRKAIEPMGTDWKKPFLETVPWIVVVFAQQYGLVGGEKRKHYYVKESVGIACGLFIAALQKMGLSTLSHTPSPMGFLSELLERPENERPYILFPIGYPKDAVVPDLRRKSLDEVCLWRE